MGSQPHRLVEVYHSTVVITANCQLLKANGVNELKEKVLKYFKSDKQLYQDILLFKVHHNVHGIPFFGQCCNSARILLTLYDILLIEHYVFYHSPWNYPISAPN